MMTPLSSFPSPASSCNGRTTASCISRVLRRVLCFSTLPLRTLHHFNKDEENIIVESCSSTPGLVARLMGLESLPVPYEKSRFPAYRELQDDNFFILSFERSKSGNKSKRKREKQRGSRRRERECSEGNLEFEIRGGNVLRPLKSCDKKSEKARAKKAKAVELGYEAEGDSENSSPNSVLEFVGFAGDQEPASSGEVSRLGKSKTRRPLSDELENCGERKGMINVENYEETWEEMGELAGMEMIKSSWLEKNGNSLMEIGRDVEYMILDQLLNEMLINLQIF